MGLLEDSIAELEGFKPVVDTKGAALACGVHLCGCLQEEVGDFLTEGLDFFEGLLNDFSTALTIGPGISANIALPGLNLPTIDLIKNAFLNCLADAGATCLGAKGVLDALAKDKIELGTLGAAFNANFGSVAGLAALKALAKLDQFREILQTCGLPDPEGALKALRQEQAAQPNLPVTGVTAFPDDGQIVLGWVNPNPFQALFRVFVDGKLRSTTTNTSTTLGSLRNGVPVDITIVVAKNDSDLQPSEPATVTATPFPPVLLAPPTGLSLVEGDKEVEVKFTKSVSSRVINYLIEVEPSPEPVPILGGDDAPTPPAPRATFSIGNLTRIVIRGLTNGVTYTFRIRAASDVQVSAPLVGMATPNPLSFLSLIVPPSVAELSSLVGSFQISQPHAPDRLPIITITTLTGPRAVTPVQTLPDTFTYSEPIVVGDGPMAAATFFVQAFGILGQTVSSTIPFAITP